MAFASLGGDRGIGFKRLEFVRVGKDPAQDLLVFGVADVFQQDGARFIWITAKRGVDFDVFTVADNQQRRIAEVARIFPQLRQCRFQVTPRLFVFPAKMVMFPDIRPALLAAVFSYAFSVAVIDRTARFVEV